MSECRICYEDTQPLLYNVCGCKGTHAAIHKLCLNNWIAHKGSFLCDVCKQHMIVPDNSIILPRGWYYIFSIWFELCMRGCIYIVLQQNLHVILPWINNGLIILYAWSYHPLIREYGSWKYLLKWLYPVYSGGGGGGGGGGDTIVYPLGTFLIMWLVCVNPHLLIVINPYRELWYIHKMLY